MGKSINQSLQVRDSAQSALADLYRMARHFGLNHAEILTRRSNIFDIYEIKTFPHWVSSYLEGYWKCLMDYAYHQDLVFGGMVNGQFYSVDRNRPDYYEKNGIEPCAYADDGLVTNRGHYWKESVNHTGTVKPFFLSAL